MAAELLDTTRSALMGIERFVGVDIEPPSATEQRQTGTTTVVHVAAPGGPP